MNPMRNPQRDKVRKTKKWEFSFSFIIGNEEKHKVEYLVDRMFGGLKIIVDDKIVQKDRLSLGTQLRWGYSFKVGEKEKHTIEIHIKRPLLLAGFRKWDYNVYDNGKLIKIIGNRFEKAREKPLKPHPRYIKDYKIFKSGYNNMDLYKSYQIFLISIIHYHVIMIAFMSILIGLIIVLLQINDLILTNPFKIIIIFPLLSLLIFILCFGCYLLYIPIMLFISPISFFFQRWFYHSDQNDYVVSLKNDELIIEFYWPILKPRRFFKSTHVQVKIPINLIDSIKPLKEEKDKKYHPTFFNKIFLKRFYRSGGIIFWPGMSNKKLLLIKLKKSIDIYNFELTLFFLFFNLSKLKNVRTDHILIDIHENEWERFIREISIRNYKLSSGRR